jgi:hypothetical protein
VRGIYRQVPAQLILLRNRAKITSFDSERLLGELLKFLKSSLINNVPKNGVLRHVNGDFHSASNNYLSSG